jgi:hypothetical protein
MPPEDCSGLRRQRPKKVPTGSPDAVQSERRPLRHLVTYGSTNKYIPVKNIKASTATANRPIQLVYLCLNTATPLKITTSVKAMDSQRCSCRTHLLQFNGTSLASARDKLRVAGIGECNRDLSVIHEDPRAGVGRGSPVSQLPVVLRHC